MSIREIDVHGLIQFSVENIQRSPKISFTASQGYTSRISRKLNPKDFVLYSFNFRASLTVSVLSGDEHAVEGMFYLTKKKKKKKKRTTEHFRKYNIMECIKMYYILSSVLRHKLIDYFVDESNFRYSVAIELAKACIGEGK